MAKKTPNFKPTFIVPGDVNPQECQPVPPAPQKLKDNNTNSNNNGGSKKEK